ncbi:MAG TPA: calcium-translocating P-type ATPase, PMCA-type [Muribaculaceae bacterium]|jgi:Ca2+-transporting ATPase|nr:calcium-translocating P-type ATPase, PMCA-type [Muribaculaceae bacterium]
MQNCVNYEGLNDVQIRESREKHGRNVLTPAAKESLFSLFLAKFKDPLIIILIVAGLASCGISLYEYYGLDKGTAVFFEPLGIFIAIILATGLAFYFEMKADKEFSILNQVNDEEAVTVVRNGTVTQIPKSAIVVGDIIMINTGEEIPADSELLEAVSLTVDESTLTGEPMAGKTADESEYDPEATFPSNHVMRGTKVIEGHGIARVFAVGDATENGKVFESAQIDNSVKTPLNEQLDRLGKLIARISFVIAAVIIIGRIGMFFVYMHDFAWLDFVTYILQTVMIAVALLAVSIPEGLPMAVTLSLAYSMRRMLKTSNLVRKMHACETMGAATVICTDKTGTLTMNRMQVAVTDFFGVDGRSASDSDMALVYEGIAVNSTAQIDDTDESSPVVVGNPTEGALLLWIRGQGKDYRNIRGGARVVAELPFTTERKYMATVVDCSDGIRRMYIKGAPEIVLGLSSVSGKAEADIYDELSGFQQKAMRTLGFACAELAGNDLNFDFSGPVSGLHSEIRFQGIVAISDPVRPDVPDAIKECLAAGIDVKIVTGDTPGTACEIGRQIGLYDCGAPEGSMITGPEFGRLTDEELLERVQDIKIIARARPMDKKRLVEALQGCNEVVAVTGDGTNDAPALKAAHVGLSMGDGTAVAKEASDITIIDNSFSSIGRAVMWGRSLYQNIQRFILFQMTVNVAACLIVLAGAFMGTESPLTVTQMLWVNLIMDTFAAMALASLPPSRTVMKDRPRSRTSFIIKPAMWRFIFSTGFVFFVILLGLVYVFEHADITSLSQLAKVHIGVKSGLTSYEISLIFTVFVMLQFWNMFNARAFETGNSALQLRHCGEFLMIAAIIFVGQIFIVTFGGEFFSVTPLRFSDWIIITCATSLVLWTGELCRLFKRIRNR